MEVRQAIRDTLMTHAQSREVVDARIGLSYTAVRLDDDRTGVAFTSFDAQDRGCQILKGLSPLRGRKASEVLDLLNSSSNVERAVGLATANAISNKILEEQEQGDVLEVLDLRKGTTIGMVGFFGPLMPKLKKMEASVTVFEKDQVRHPHTRPENDAFDYLPRCEVALITSTSIVNGTVDPLLEAARPCREVVLLGASTPLIPEVFQKTSVSRLSGVIVTDPERILGIVSEGGGMHLFKNSVKKVNISIEIKKDS
jgi:uncharacterized protein (DUF4213/DUF364 family)